WRRCVRRPMPCAPGWGRRRDPGPTRSAARSTTPSSGRTRRPQPHSRPPGPGTGRSTSTPWRACACGPPAWPRTRSMAAACARSAIRRASTRTGATSAPAGWRPWSSSNPLPDAPCACAHGAALCSAEVVDQVHRAQGVGTAGRRILDLGVVARLQAGLEGEALVHRHRHAEVVLGEGVVLSGLDQQGVEQFGVAGQLVAQVQQAASDQAALHLAVERGARAAVTRTDFTGELGALVVDETAAQADGHRALVVVGGEVVVLVAAVGRQVVARVEAVGAGAGDVVAVGAGLVAALLDAVAVGVALDLGARAQRRQGEAVLPPLLLAGE